VEANLGGRVPRVATDGIALVIILAALHLAQELVVPIALALLFYALLQPLVELLTRKWRLPVVAGAILVVLGSLGAITGVFVMLSAPATAWVHDAPQTLAKARTQAERVLAPLRRIAGSAPGQAPKPGGGGTPGKAAEPRQTPASGQPAQPGESGQSAQGGQGSGLPVSNGVIGRAFGTTFGLIGAFVEVVLLLLFLLASGNGFRERVGRAFPLAGDAGESARVMREMERVVGRYIGVSAVINLGQAILVGLAMWALGMPKPIIWAVLTFVLEWVPYLGGLAIIVFLFATGLAADMALGRALLAPAAYLAITTVQNNLVSPLAYSQGLRLNPGAILVAVMTGWFLWGAAGAFLAVPVLAALKVLSDRTGVMAPLGRMAG
jgi:predicted PurR-regulated permease PerM